MTNGPDKDSSKPKGNDSEAWSHVRYCRKVTEEENYEGELSLKKSQKRVNISQKRPKSRWILEKMLVKESGEVSGEVTVQSKNPPNLSNPRLPPPISPQNKYRLLCQMMAKLLPKKIVQKFFPLPSRSVAQWSSPSKELKNSSPKHQQEP